MEKGEEKNKNNNEKNKKGESCLTYDRGKSLQLSGQVFDFRLDLHELVDVNFLQLRHLIVKLLLQVALNRLGLCLQLLLQSGLETFRL